MPALPKSLIGAHTLLVAARQKSRSLPPLTAQDDDAGHAEPVVEARAQYITRDKTTTKAKHPDMVAAEEEAAERGLQVTLPFFAVREFDTYAEFEAYLKAYGVEHNVSLRTRHSRLRESVNDKRAEVYAALKAVHEKAHAKWKDEQKNGVGNPNGPEPTLPEYTEIPGTLTHAVQGIRCTHGTYHCPRGTGERFAAATRYTGCKARLDADAKFDPVTKKWKVVISKENTVHNHAVSQILFESYLNSSLIDNSVLYETIRGQVDVGGNGRRIRDNISTALHRTYSSSQFNNLRNYHFGAGLAAANLRMLVDRFCEYDDSRCLMIEEEGTEAQVSGIVFQTSMQRKQFELYGDSLILDWTHNTNNAGYYLGSLMATSATGKGVTVLNFLCLNQGKEMMKAVLRYFVVENPGALEKIRSVVIDKDYTEWKAIEEICTNSMVVLCQFHVLKWLKQVVRDTKYHIDPTVQHTVMRLVRQMVYSASKDQFVRVQYELKALLCDAVHEDFHDYMDARWYQCKRMWANYKRGQIFTAGNTTSNRLESHWKQVKEVLAKRRRLDLCFEAVILRETSITRRELAEFVDYATRMHLHTRAPEFLRPALRKLSASRAQLITKQWASYMARPASYSTVEASDGRSDYYVRVKTSTTTYHFGVSTGPWSCSCRFAVSHELPCRHQLYVAHHTLCESAFPVSAIATRWRMDAPMVLLEQMRASIDELAELRIANLATDLATILSAHHPDGTEVSGVKFGAPSSAKRVKTATFVKLRRREISQSVVLDDLGKRDVVLAQFSRLLARMMGLGTQRFWDCSARLEVAINAFMASEEGPDGQAQEPPAVEADMVVWEDKLGYHEDATVCGHAAACDEDDEDFEEEDADFTPVGSEIPCSPSLLTPTTRPQSSTSFRFSPQSPSTAVNSIDALFADIDEIGGVGSGSLLAEAMGDMLATTHQNGFSLFDAGEFQLSQPTPMALHQPVAFPLTLAAPVASPPTPPATDAPLPAPSVTETLVPAMAPARQRARGARAFQGTPALNTRGAKRKAEPEVFATRGVKHKARSEVGDAVAAPPTDPDADSEKTTASPSRGPTRLKLPATKRATTRQRKQQSTVTGRVAVIEGHSDCPVIVEDVTDALKHIRLASGSGVVAAYPELYTDTMFRTRYGVAAKSTSQKGLQPTTFAVPKAVANNLVAALNEKRSSGGRGDEISVDAEAGYTVKIPGVPHIFTASAIRAQVEFHELKGRLARYNRDTVWLAKDETWTATASTTNPSFLARYGDECSTQADKLGISQMRALTLASLGSASLNTRVTVQQEPDAPSALQAAVSVPVEQILGRFSNNEWLNDTVINLALHFNAAMYDDVTVIDSLNHGFMNLPSARLDGQRLVVFPLNYESGPVKHWCLICVEFAPGRPPIAFMYDPLLKAMWKKRVMDSWLMWCRPLLQLWHKRDGLEETGGTNPTHSTDDIEEQWVSQPRQSDGYNCGVFCIAQAASYMTPETDYAWQDLEEVAPAALQILRLRIMYMLVCKAAQTRDEEGGVRAEETYAALLTYDTAKTDAEKTKKSRR